MTAHSNCSDDAFGPALSCHGSFDFTLVFEQSIFSIASSAICLLLLPLRLYKILRSTTKTHPSHVYAGKATLSVLLFGLQVTLVALWTKTDDSARTAVPYAVVSLIALGALSTSAVLVEHDRSLLPSSLFIVYLFVSCVFDAVQVRTLFLRGHFDALKEILLAAVLLKLALLCLEAKSKRNYLRDPYNLYPPEILASIFNRAVFWWLNPTFVLGYKTGLTLDSLCDIDDATGGRHALVLALYSAIQLPLLIVILPRLCLVGFNYAQPFLIDRAIRLITEAANEETTNDGRGLIGATALIYLGIAISTAAYQYLLYRSLTIARGALVSLIYVASLQTVADDQDEAKVITLMSTDVERTVTGLEMVHETWARLLEIAIGVWLLARQMGAIPASPILVALVCFVWQIWLARYMGPRQGPWLEALQTRVGRTSLVLRNVKNVRMTGLTNAIEETLQSGRIRELHLSKQFRWMIVWINMAGLVLNSLPVKNCGITDNQSAASMPHILAPLVTFAAYAIRSRVDNSEPLSTAQAFSSLAIVSLVTGPTVDLLSSIPALRVSEGCLDRIQTCLRSICTEPGQKRNMKDDDLSQSPTTPNTSVKMTSMPAGARDIEYGLVSVTGLDLRPIKEADLILNNANISIPEAKLTVITGPSRCGKTTSLKAILGEVSPQRGSITKHTSSIAYCSQTPWLPNGPFRNVLCGSESFDEVWYNTVLYACDLQEDILQLPHGDLSTIGTRGSVLSAGQRQRLALARAVYAHKRLLLLDDVMSALDRDTALNIAERLFSERGYYESQTVQRFWSHMQVRFTLVYVHYISMADYVLVFDPNARTIHAQSPDDLSRLGLLSILPEGSGASKDPDSNAKTSAISGKTNNATQEATQEDLEDLARRTGDTSLYIFWIQWYTDDPAPRVLIFTGVYVMLVVVVSLSQGAMIWKIMISIVPQSGAVLHQILLRTVMHAPMRFFSTTDSGLILNRFSQDMTLVDVVLPTVSFGTFLSLIQCLAQLIFITLGSSYMAICIPVLISVLYLVQKFYLRTSRQLRFLDLEAKSPLFTHFTETMEGLASIRAFKWWLNLVLYLTVAAMATILVALALSLRATTSRGSLGVALTAILSFSQGLQSMLVSWTQMETSLGAVARTKSLEALVSPEEANDKVQSPPADWPREGRIEFRNISASYDGDNLTLRDLSLLVDRKQKIGIIGRTGSSKSTLVSTLLRLLDTVPSAGHGTSNAAAIPQESLILQGTVRYNMDPTRTAAASSNKSLGDNHKLHDNLMTSALRSVGLWDIIETRGGLDGQITQESLSQGQMQLLALARTIVRKDIFNARAAARSSESECPPVVGGLYASGGQSVSLAQRYWTPKILLLDEATSHLDAETDAKVQRLMREEFKDFTIIMVAHRIESVADADMVGLMEGGRLVRFSPPETVIGTDLTKAIATLPLLLDHITKQLYEEKTLPLIDMESSEEVFTQVTLVEDGDLIIKISDTNTPCVTINPCETIHPCGNKQFLVDSNAVSRSSEKWKDLVAASGHDTGQKVVALEGNAASHEILFSIMHLSSHAFATSLGCYMDPTSPSMARSGPYEYNNYFLYRLRERIWIAWVLGKKDLFKELISIVIKDAYLDEDSKLSICQDTFTMTPNIPGLLEYMEKERKERPRQLLDVFQEMRKRKDRTESFCRNARVCFDNEMSMCECIVADSLSRGFHDEVVGQAKQHGEDTESINDTYERLKNIKILNLPTSQPWRMLQIL
ncbi:multidrug resistance protein [Apiospora phragmitis]|uniref:Multidrug resistance protein n=1 Tax=Apiospora phragmitis TaxID=2905665 RepID=A0ABR1X6X4_9PEZI